MRRRARIALKVLVWVIGLAPIAALLYWFQTNDLTPNPISFITNTLGQWTLRFLLASLSMTPLRILFGVSWPVLLRRLLGLLAFSYACLHFGVWIVLDHFFAWSVMGADIVKRPYITVGMSTLLALTPLAVTSTAGMVRRLGAANWRRLHRLAYLAGVLGVLHFLWLAKVGRDDPYYYAVWLTVVLGIRLVDGARRFAARRRHVAAGPVPGAPRPGKPGKMERPGAVGGGPPDGGGLSVSS